MCRGGERACAESRPLLQSRGAPLGGGDPTAQHAVFRLRMCRSLLRPRPQPTPDGKCSSWGRGGAVRACVRACPDRAGRVPCAWAHPSRTQSGAVLRPRAPVRPGPGQKVCALARRMRDQPPGGQLRHQGGGAGPRKGWRKGPREAQRQPGGRGCARRGSEPSQFLRGCEQCRLKTKSRPAHDWLARWS